MPTYEYACEKCGHEFERAQRIHDAPVKTCPSCRSRKVRRLISRTAFVLKGSGWYSDLYASKKPAADKEGTAADKEGTAADKEGAAAGAKDASESGGKGPAKEAGGSEAASETKSGSDGKSGSEAKPAAKSKGKSKTPKSAA